MISESDSRIFMLLVKILVSASRSQTANYLFLTRHLHWCSTLPRGETRRSRDRDANLFHSSSLKRPKWNGATKHIAFGVTGVILTFPQPGKKIALIAVAIDVATHNWAECVTSPFSLLCGLLKVFSETGNWSGSRRGRLRESWFTKRKSAPVEHTEHHRFLFLF